MGLDQGEQIARVKFSFTHRNEDELDIKFNDIVRIISNGCVEGWSEIEFQGKTGKVPTDYVQQIPSPYEGAVGTAEFSFEHPKEADTGQFLNFAEGAEILVIDRPPSGWCVGIYKSHIGLFPENYVTFPSAAKFEDFEKVCKSFLVNNMNCAVL